MVVSIAKMNERVQNDLEKQTELLNQAKAECKKLESSAVRRFLKARSAVLTNV
jgi:hypothetical protein